MSLTNFDQIISTLDRKYKFTTKSPPETFFIDLKKFIDFLLQDERVSGFTNKLLFEAEECLEKYGQQFKKEQARAVNLKKQICKTYPTLDDSNSVRKSKLDFDYENTFAAFEDLLKYEEHQIKKLIYLLNTYRNETLPHKLLRILEMKVRSVNDEKISSTINELSSENEYWFKEAANFYRTSPGWALNQIQIIIRSMNPPLDVNGSDRVSLYLIGEGARHATYEKARNCPSTSEVDEKVKRDFKKTKESLRRVYEALREEIGSSLYCLEIIKRYKARCEWYNYDNLRLLVKNKKRKEDPLTRDLVTYIFDQGTTVLYRTRFGVKETDVISVKNVQSENPIIVEVKVYSSSNERSRLIQGIHQLYGYLSTLEHYYKYISAGYFIYYRIGGPTYQFSESIKIGRFTIYPIFIDIAPSKQSGSKQGKIIFIKNGEILDTLPSK